MTRAILLATLNLPDVPPHDQLSWIAGPVNGRPALKIASLLVIGRGATYMLEPFDP
jgi:hypothetical protein